MNTTGFIKLHRSVLDWAWYDDVNTFRLFVHIILRANFDDVLWKNDMLIPRGSMVTSFRSLSNETGLSLQQTKSALRHLQDSKQIEICTTNKFSIITVVNYDVYQGEVRCGNTQTNTQTNKQIDTQTTRNPTTRKEIEEEKEKRNKECSLLSAEDREKPHQKNDYVQIVDAFNRICRSLPQVRGLHESRKKAIRACAQTVAAFGGWDKLFTTVEESDFLTGRSGTWNGCGFDWILNPRNLVKITEGNYANKKMRKDDAVYAGDLDFGATY